MVYIGQRAAHLITGCVSPCLFLYGGRSHSLLVAFSPTCTFTHAPIARLGPMQVQPGCAKMVVVGGGRVKEALSREAGKPAGPLSGAGMQKMWKQLGSESWGFQSPEVTKGFHPGSVGRGGRRWAADSDGIL